MLHGCDSALTLKGSSVSLARAMAGPRTAPYSAYKSEAAQLECGTMRLYVSAPPFRKSTTMALYGRSCEATAATS